MASTVCAPSGSATGIMTGVLQAPLESAVQAPRFAEPSVIVTESFRLKPETLTVTDWPASPEGGFNVTVPTRMVNGVVARRPEAAPSAANVYVPPARPAGTWKLIGQ